MVKPKARFKASISIWGTYLFFDYGTISKVDDVLLEHSGLPHILPLTIHLTLFCRSSRGDHSKTLLHLVFCRERPLYA